MLIFTSSSLGLLGQFNPGDRQISGTLAIRVFLVGPSQSDSQHGSSNTLVRPIRLSYGGRQKHHRVDIEQRVDDIPFIIDYCVRRKI